MPLFHAQQEILVVGRRVGHAVPVASEIHVVGVDVDENHAAMAGDPIGFTFPDPRIGFPQQQKDRRILWQRVRQLDVALAADRLTSPLRPWNPVGKNGVRPSRLGFEWIRVKGRAVVIDIQIMEPIELAQHEAGSEPFGLPLVKVVINAPRLGMETGTRTIELPIVLEIMDSDFKSPLNQPVPQPFRHAVAALRDEVER